MREMADRPGYQIMILIVKDNGDRFQRGDELPVFLYFFFRYFRRRRQDIVSVFDQVRFGVCETAFFRPCHGMPADETFFHAE